MALIKCPECKKEISDVAKSCPHCGYTNGTEIVQPERSSFFKTDTWKDLKLPILWIPLLAFIANFMLTKFLSAYNLRGYSETSNITLLIFAFLGAAVTNLAYLTIPLIIRFAILKHPMKQWGWQAELSAVVIGVFVKVCLKSAGLVMGHSSSVPILQVIAVYLVLFAGHPRTSLYFTEKDNHIRIK